MTSRPEKSTQASTRRAGAGHPILLLHGFPQTHLMWRDVAPLLARQFTVICADLRGYGRSGCPTSDPGHVAYAKRAMARDMVIAMQRLGYSRFSVVGHDRGGRVAYRMALDYPDHISRIAVLDILPTTTVWECADAKFALAFWPWSLRAQPEPLPERLLKGAPDAVVDDALGGWRSPADVFSPDVPAAYIQALSNGANVHTMCEEYRAAASVDREHDDSDRAGGRRISCPLLALWSARGALNTWYKLRFVLSTARLSTRCSRAAAAIRQSYACMRATVLNVPMRSPCCMEASLSPAGPLLGYLSGPR
jgi:haloacetate dehalogenase